MRKGETTMTINEKSPARSAHQLYLTADRLAFIGIYNTELLKTYAVDLSMGQLKLGRA